MRSLSKCEPLNFGEGSLSELSTLAGLLVDAKNPVFIPGRYGKSNDSVQDLAKLAQVVGGAVIDTGWRFNFPSNHDLNLTGRKKESCRMLM